MLRVPIGEAEIHYEEQGSGPPPLLVSGLSGLGSSWALQVADFARDFHTWRPASSPLSTTLPSEPS